MLALADTYDALASRRSYKKEMTAQGDIFAIMTNMASNKLDPAMLIRFEDFINQRVCRGLGDLGE